MLTDFVRGDENDLVRAALFHLRSQASTLWLRKKEALERDNVQITWHVFSGFLISAYGMDNPKDLARDTLDALTVASCGTIQKYFNHFRKEMAVLGNDRSPHDYVYRFLKGLPRSLQTSCKILFGNQPEAPVDDYMAFAAKFGKSDVDTAVRSDKIVATGKRRRAPDGDDGRGGTQAKLQPLTDEERARCIAEGRCFRCRKVGHHSDACPTSWKSRGGGGDKSKGVNKPNRRDGGSRNRGSGKVKSHATSVDNWRCKLSTVK